MGSRGLLPALALAAAAGLSPAAANDLGDQTRGFELFKRQCSACHQIGPDARNRVGPVLTG